MNHLIRADEIGNREILIIEDSPTQAAKLRHMLEQYGFTVSITGNGVDPC
jgi:DNA-binding response OmpR family regulator